MQIKPGDVISIRHYSGINPFKSVVEAIDEEYIRVHITKDFAVMNFLEGDPVVFGYELKETVYIYGCIVSSINIKENIIALKIDSMEQELNRRQYERYPVSLYADIKLRDTRKKYLGTIKDISYSGMFMFSKAELEVNDSVDLDIYLEKNMVFLKATIMRKTQTPHHFEYGVGIIYEDRNSISFMKQYIDRLKQEQEDSIRRLGK